MWKIVITTIIENRGKTAVADKSAWDYPSLDEAKHEFQESLRDADRNIFSVEVCDYVATVERINSRFDREYTTIELEGYCCG